MRRVRALAFFALVAAAPAALAQAPPTYGCDSPESKRLDFWVGEWELTYKNAKGEPAKSRNLITKTLDGCVVLEEFTGAPGTKLDGRSSSTYDRATRRWRQAWVDNTASYLDFEGATVDGNMAFVRSVTKDGKTTHQRMVWREVMGDRLRWLWKWWSVGAFWTTLWDFAYLGVI
jgi:hypothetical protein